MSVTVRGRVPFNKQGRFTEEIASHIKERLQTLEKAIAGGAQAYVTPSHPAFTPVPGPGGGGGGTGGGGGGITDHGALTGLGDNDHPHYLQHAEAAIPRPHQHVSGDLVGLDRDFYPRGERVPPRPHDHVMAEVRDLRPDDMQFILAHRIFGS